jgi:hypothetical protein
MRSSSLNRNPVKIRRDLGRGRANHLDYNQIKLAHNKAKAEYKYYTNAPNRRGSSRFYGSTEKKAQKKADNYLRTLKGTPHEFVPPTNPTYTENRSNRTRSRSGSRSRNYSNIRKFLTGNYSRSASRSSGSRSRSGSRSSRSRSRSGNRTNGM